MCQCQRTVESLDLDLSDVMSVLEVVSHLAGIDEPAERERLRCHAIDLLRQAIERQSHAGRLLAAIPCRSCQALSD